MLPRAPLMPLLGMFGILFCAGFAMYFAGLFFTWWMLKRHGGADRTKVLFVVFDDESPMKQPGARRDRLVFRAGVFLMAAGAMTVFSGLSVGEGREQRVCGDLCKMKGFYGGRFAPSASVRDDDGNPQRACWCAGPGGSTELVQPKLPMPGEARP